MMSETRIEWQVGDHVEGGDSHDDYDHGYVVAVDEGEVTVAWEQSLVTTTQPGRILRAYGEAEIC